MEKENAHYVAKESSTFKKIKNTIDFNFIYYFKYFNSLFLSSKKYVCIYTCLAYFWLCKLSSISLSKKTLPLSMRWFEIKKFL